MVVGLQVGWTCILVVNLEYPDEQKENHETVKSLPPSWPNLRKTWWRRQAEATPHAGARTALGNRGSSDSGKIAVSSSCNN